MKFGENMKALRTQKKLSQEKLAEQLGISRQSISKWETGEAYPEMKHLLKLCDLFNCRIDTLVHDHINDVDSLDKDIQRHAIKLSIDKQKRIQKLCSFICDGAKPLKYFFLIALVFSIIVFSALPFVPEGFVIYEDHLVYLGENYPFHAMNQWLSSETGRVIAHLFMGFCCFSELVCFFFTFRFFHHLEHFFNNIKHQSTPFLYENTLYLKKLCLDLILIYILPLLNSIAMTFLKGGDHDFEKTSIFFFILLLFLFVSTYLFEYGVEIQKDSSGILYSMEMEREPD